MSFEEILKVLNPKRISISRRDQVHPVGILNFYRLIAATTTTMGRNSQITTMMHRSLRDHKTKRKAVWLLERFREKV